MAFLVVLNFGCSTIDIAASKNTGLKSKIKKIAIFPFSVDGARWGDEFSDAISHHFFKKANIEIVERSSLEKILKEQSLSMSGMIDQSKALKIGKMIGADLIFLGRGSALKMRKKGDENVSNLIDTFSLKAINVETGVMILTVRKESGRDWDAEYRAKFCLSLTIIWDRRDVLIESSNYDEIAEKIVDKVLSSVRNIKS